MPDHTRTAHVVRLPRPRVPVPGGYGDLPGTLALDLTPRETPPPPPRSTRGTVVALTHEDRRRRSLEQWAGRFGRAVAEIIGGDRPVAQVLRWTSRAVYEDLRARADVVGLAGGHVPGRRPVQPARPQVRSVHARMPAPEVGEVAIHLRYGARSRALAARFDWVGERWLCTALEYGGM